MRNFKLILLAAFILIALSIATNLNLSPSKPVNSEPATNPPAILRNSTSFIAFGDSGSGLTAQKELAKTIENYHQQSPFTSVLLLGDLIYPDGNVKRYGKERFTDPYKPLLDKGIVFKATLGNHDIFLNHKQEVMEFFKMPSSYYDFVVGPIHFLALDTNQFNQKQASWLTQRLAQSKSDWKILFGHHPVYSSGSHGVSASLMRDLKPIMEIYKANLYLAGHDHAYERFYPVNGVTYMVSGGGGAELRHFRRRILSNSAARSVSHHFIHFELKDNILYFKTVDKNGQIIDSGKIIKIEEKPLMRPAA